MRSGTRDVSTIFISRIPEFLAVRRRIWSAVTMIYDDDDGGELFFFFFFSWWLRLFWYRFVDRFETRKFYRKEFSYCFFRILVVERNEKPNRGWTFLTDFKNSSTFMPIPFLLYEFKLLDPIIESLVAKFSKKLLKISSLLRIIQYPNTPISHLSQITILPKETICCTHMV